MRCSPVRAGLRAGLVALVALVACTGSDPDPAFAPGAHGSDGGAADAARACTGPARCADDGSLVTCAGTQACALGCDPVLLHCKGIAPSGAARSADATGASAVTVLDATSTTWFDPATGAIGPRDAAGIPTGTPLRAGGDGVVAGIAYAYVAQSDGSRIGIWTFGGLTVPAGATVKAYGTAAFALVSLGDLVVAGTVSVGADCVNNAPGPGAPAASAGSNGAAGVTALTNPGFKYACAAGGGGGNGTAGGTGASALVKSTDGTSTVQANGGAAGAARAGSLLVDPLLLGGGRGGGGADSKNSGLVTGGAGGGAVQLVASGTLTVSGLVDAAGCGGKKGWGGTLPIDDHYCRGSGGGGAGGSILLEAAVVHVTPAGRVLANGGGGGGGCTAVDSHNGPHPTNTDGASNSVDGARARGGQSDESRADSACSPGQAGNVPVPGPGTSETPAGSCGTNDHPAAASGGGGGSGTVAVRTRDARVSVDPGGVVNPPPDRDLAAVR